MSIKFYVANTYAEAKAHAPEGWKPIGRHGPTYCTPDAIMIETPLDLEEKTWDWLMREVHLYDVKDVRWVPR